MTGLKAYLRKEYHDSGLEGKISFELYKEFIVKKLSVFNRAAEKLKYDLKREIGALEKHKNFKDIMDYIEDNHQLLYRIMFGCDEEGDEYGDEDEEDGYSPGSNTNYNEDEDSSSEEDSPESASPHNSMHGGARRRRRTAKRRYRVTRKKRTTK